MNQRRRKVEPGRSLDVAGNLDLVGPGKLHQLNSRHKDKSAVFRGVFFFIAGNLNQEVQ